MAEPWRTGTVIKIENETGTTRRYWIQVNELEHFNFLPGQFVTLDLPIHEKLNKRWRSYSIASEPDGTNVFELVIVLLEGGAGTTYLFNNVTVGHQLSLRGPQGIFVLPTQIDRDLYLICTGTGIAPFRSMVHHIKRFDIQYQHIYLIFGCRTRGDVLYCKELKELEKDLPRYQYLTTCSREDTSLTTVMHGYVHKVYEDLLAIEKPPAYFYLCGWKNMIDEAKERIQALGYSRKDIHLEVYG